MWFLLVGWQLITALYLLIDVYHYLQKCPFIVLFQITLFYFYFITFYDARCRGLFILWIFMILKHWFYCFICTIDVVVIGVLVLWQLIDAGDYCRMMVDDVLLKCVLLWKWWHFNWTLDAGIYASGICLIWGSLYSSSLFTLISTVVTSLHLTQVTLHSNFSSGLNCLYATWLMWYVGGFEWILGSILRIWRR